MLLINGDMNAKVGSDNTNYEKAMGRLGCRVINDNEGRLIDFCPKNNCVIGGNHLPT